MTAEAPSDPSAEDFKLNWIRPRDALAMLAPMGSAAAAKEVYRRLRPGLLWGAGSVGETNDFRADDGRRSVIPALWWNFAPRVADPESDFWIAGGLTLTIPPPPTRPGPDSTYEHFGIRFEPEGLRRIARDAGIDLNPEATALASALRNYKPPPTPAAPDERKPISQSDQKRFCEVYIGVHGDSATERGAYQAVQAMFPDKKVARDPFFVQFRAIRGPQLPGRKKQSGKD